MKLIGIPNLLTLFRLVLCPIFLLLYLKPGWFGVSGVVFAGLLLFILIVLELTDAFDGFFARRYNRVTDFGKIFDPMADSIARITVFLTMTAPPVQLPVVYVFIFIYRDSVISCLRSLSALSGQAMGARSAGKIKAIIQACAALAVVAAMIPYSLKMISQETLWWIGVIAVGVAALQSIYSGILYLYDARCVIWKAMTTLKS